MSKMVKLILKMISHSSNAQSFLAIEKGKTAHFEHHMSFKHVITLIHT